MSSEGKFVLKKRTSFREMRESNTELPESDLCFQDGEYVYQYKYIPPVDTKEYKISPGSWILVHGSSEIELKKFKFKQRHLLESISNTSKIMKEAKTFFSKLDVYDKLNRPKKRGVLLYSAPGMGKTSAIEQVCLDLMAEDPGTVVIVWPTSEINADDVNNLLSVNSSFTLDCTRMVLIIEDIGGGEYEKNGVGSVVESGLLNLLDGVGVVFKLPTFIIATTNYPENLLSSLADRPGRFDLMLKLQPPSFEEKVQLMEFISKRPLSKEEKEVLNLKEVQDFSIAHLEEIVVRSELHDKTYIQVIQEMIAHKALFNREFKDEPKSIGIHFD